MSGIGFSEFLILCLIGLIVLGPQRLPKVASQIGGWIGQARRMTRVMRRQLEEELDLDEELSIKPPIHSSPREDDEYSPLHDEASTDIADVDDDIDADTSDEPNHDSVDNNGSTEEQELAEQTPDTTEAEISGERRSSA
jgi:sec-independent protein translocase protein TatB